MNLSQWMTPRWAAELLVERYFADLTHADLVLEPSAGTGAFLQVLPEHVPAIGVEIDAALAAQAEVMTGRRIYVGDFRTIEISERPTVILGNPPYNVRLIDQFLTRAARLVPDDGRCGFLLPAYAMQTHRRVLRWHDTWSMAAEIIPRRLFPRLRLPLVFVLFKKERVRTLVGFALFQESVDFEHLSAGAKAVLTDGRPHRSTWRAAVEWAFQTLGNRPASLEEIYAAIEPRRPTPNAFWREKVRQILQRYFHPVERGVWEAAV